MMIKCHKQQLETETYQSTISPGWVDTVSERGGK
jgi:hypothetical protein